MSWDSLSKVLAGFDRKLQGAKNWVQELTDIPSQADEVAERLYPDSARDASTKNAFRHALGTGMMTQKLGGGPVAATAAKMAGWGWELPTLLDPRSTDAQRLDSRHDLNANAIGAITAQRAASPAELEMALRRYADQAVVAQPPKLFEPHAGQMTRSVR